MVDLSIFVNARLFLVELLPFFGWGFFLSCDFFGDQFPNKNTKINILFNEPMKYWPVAKACFKRLIDLSSKALNVIGLDKRTRNKNL